MPQPTVTSVATIIEAMRAVGTDANYLVTSDQLGARRTFVVDGDADPWDEASRIVSELIV